MDKPAPPRDGSDSSHKAKDPPAPLVEHDPAHSTRTDLPAKSAQLASAGVIPQVEIAHDAQSMHDKLHPGFFSGLVHGKDTDGMEAMVGSMTVADRQRFAAEYQKTNGIGLRDDLRAQLGADSPEFRKIEGMLNQRRDGETNNAANVMTALETMRNDPAKGQAMLRSSLSVLNTKQLSQLGTQFQSDYPDAFKSGQKSIKDVIDSTPGLTDANRQVIDTMLAHGTDNRSAADIVGMAHQAVQAGDLRMFGDVVNGDSPAALAARKQLQGDGQFMKQYSDTFMPDGADPTQKAVANDYLKEGHVSLPTIISGNSNVLMGFLDNPKNVDQAVANATPKERADFTLGRQVSENGGQPKNDQEKDAYAYYQRMEQAMRDGKVGAAQMTSWEDQLEHGHKTLLSNVTDAAKNNSGSPQAVMSSIENMTREDWNLLHDPKNGAEYRKRLLGSMGIYAEDQVNRVNKLIDQKMAAGSYDASVNVKRPLEEVIADNRRDSHANENIGSAIASMSPADAQKYKTDPAFHKRIDDAAGRLDGSAQYLAQSALTQVGESGKPPVLNAAQQVIKDGLDDVGADKALQHIETMLQDQGLRARLSKNIYELQGEDRKLAASLMESTHMNGTEFQMMMQSGHVPLGYLAANNQVGTAAWYHTLASMPANERTQWTSQYMNPAEQEVLNNAIQQKGQLTLADRMRGYVLNPGGHSFEDFQGELSKLTPKQREDLKTEYEKKYHTNLADDFVGKVDSDHKDQYMGYLSPPNDGIGSYVSASQKQATDVVADVSDQTVAKAQSTFQAAVEANTAKHSSLFASDPYMSFMSAALEQNKQARTDLMMTGVDAGLLASIPLTLGADSEVAAPALMARAGTRVASGLAERAAVGTGERLAEGAAERVATDGFADAAATGGRVVGSNGGQAVVDSAADRGAADIAAGETSGTARGAVAPVVQEAAPVVQEAAPVVQEAAPVVQKAAPVVQEAAPVVQEAAPVVQEAAPVVQEAAPVVQEAAPVVQEAAPVVQEAAPVVQEAAPVVQEAAPVVQEAAPVVSEQSGVARATQEVAPASEDAGAVRSAQQGAPTQPVRQPLAADEGDAAAAAERRAAAARANEQREGVASARETRAGTVADADERAAAAASARAATTDGAAADAAATDAARLTGGAVLARAAQSAAGAVLGAEVAKVTKPAETKLPPPPPQIEPNDKLIQMATVRRGEGPWQSAERILGRKASVDEVRTLTKVMQSMYTMDHNGNADMSNLKEHYNFVTKDNFARLMSSLDSAKTSPQVRDKVRARLMEFAQAS